MSLPEHWINRIFEKLTLTYGRDFVNRWESVGLPIEDVKSDWAHELAWYEKSPEGIKYALENLPKDKPPNVLQFRDLCRSSPVVACLQLPEPPVNLEKRDAALAKLKEFTTNFRKDFQK